MRQSLTLLLSVAALSAAALPALAEDTRWSDGQFLQASRCLGLARASMTPDAARALAVRLKVEGRGRGAYVSERGANLRDQAAAEARRGGEERQARLTAEREGSCKVYLAPPVAAD